MSKAKILVVDDEMELREILKDLLEANGFEVKTAGDFLEALNSIKATQFDCVVSDMRLPKGSGMDILKALQAHYKINIPFILVTGFCDLDAEDAKEKGVNAFFTKPFSYQSLITKIQSAIQNVTPPQEPQT